MYCRQIIRMYMNFNSRSKARYNTQQCINKCLMMLHFDNAVVKI